MSQNNTYGINQYQSGTENGDWRRRCENDQQQSTTARAYQQRARPDRLTAYNGSSVTIHHTGHFSTCRSAFYALRSPFTRVNPRLRRAPDTAGGRHAGFVAPREAPATPDPAQPFLDPPKPILRFHDLLPTYYRGEHVKPVIKTKPDGSRWVLTPELQARGVLQLYQPL